MRRASVASWVRVLRRRRRRQRQPCCCPAGGLERLAPPPAVPSRALCLVKAATALVAIVVLTLVLALLLPRVEGRARTPALAPRWVRTPVVRRWRRCERARSSRAQRLHGRAAPGSGGNPRQLRVTKGKGPRGAPAVVAPILAAATAAAGAAAGVAAVETTHATHGTRPATQLQLGVRL